MYRNQTPIGVGQNRKPSTSVSVNSVRFSADTELPPKFIHGRKQFVSSQDCTHTQRKSEANKIRMFHKLTNSRFTSDEASKLSSHDLTWKPTSTEDFPGHAPADPTQAAKPPQCRCCCTSPLARGLGSPRRRPPALCAATVAGRQMGAGRCYAARVWRNGQHWACGCVFVC